MDHWLGELQWYFDANVKRSPFSSSVICARHGRRVDNLFFKLFFDLDRNGMNHEPRSDLMSGGTCNLVVCFTFIVSLASPLLDTLYVIF